MHAVWLLLAKSRFGAELIQTSSQNGLETVEVPFEIDAVFIPDYFRRHDEQLAELSAGTSPPTAAFDDIKHQSRVMNDVIRRASLLAIRSAAVLLLGESGTGKELFATAIHNASPRRAKPLKTVNCGAIPDALVESELFGHRKGAFTGADRDKIGLFEAAHGGTVFLDEVGDLPMVAQVKLLRVLQEGVVQAIGDEGKPRKVDVRIIAATHKDLAAETAAGLFREDLFYRLAVGVLRLPAVRERGAGDLNLLIDHLLGEVNRKARAETGGQDKKLSPGARRVLRQHAWPGNVRELVNTLTRAVIFTTGTEIKESDARDALLAVPRRTRDDLLGRPIADGVDLPAMIDVLKRHYVQRALDEAHGNKTKAAKLVGLDNYQTLTNWMKAAGVPEPT
jgi:transcriptional regulator with PAS, ATPase and Fis domain